VAPMERSLSSHQRFWKSLLHYHVSYSGVTPSPSLVKGNPDDVYSEMQLRHYCTMLQTTGVSSSAKVEVEPPREKEELRRNDSTSDICPSRFVEHQLLVTPPSTPVPSSPSPQEDTQNVVKQILSILSSSTVPSDSVNILEISFQDATETEANA